MSTPPPPAGSSELPLVYLLKQVELAVRSRLDAMLRPEGLTALQFATLATLDRRPGLSSAELARLSFVTAQTMADMVTALEHRGLLSRRRDARDRRRLVLDLTDDGREALARFRPRVREIEDEMLSGVTEGQAAQLRELLLACRAGLA